MLSREKSQQLSSVDSRAALKGFFVIADLWKLSAEQCQRILGEPTDDAYASWKRGEAKNVPNDTLRRIGYVAGIFKALEIIYSDPRQADGWIRRPNRHFAGQSPLKRMLAGDVTDLAAVRAYVDAARAPWS